MQAQSLFFERGLIPANSKSLPSRQHQGFFPCSCLQEPPGWPRVRQKKESAVHDEPQISPHVPLTLASLIKSTYCSDKFSNISKGFSGSEGARTRCRYYQNLSSAKNNYFLSSWCEISPINAAIRPLHNSWNLSSKSKNHPYISWASFLGAKACYMRWKYYSVLVFYIPMNWKQKIL